MCWTYVRNLTRINTINQVMYLDRSQNLLQLYCSRKTLYNRDINQTFNCIQKYFSTLLSNFNNFTKRKSVLYCYPSGKKIPKLFYFTKMLTASICQWNFENKIITIQRNPLWTMFIVGCNCGENSLSGRTNLTLDIVDAPSIILNIAVENLVKYSSL